MKACIAHSILHLYKYFLMDNVILCEYFDVIPRNGDFAFLH